MTEDVPTAADRALDRHGAFEQTGDGEYAVETTPFDAVVRPEPIDEEGRDATFDVQVDVPTLDAAVANEDVAAVIEDGWFDTLALRLEDAYDVAEVDPVAEPTVSHEGDVVHAHFRFTAWNADAGVDDAKAIADFVEGTYVQGVIPGYEYDDPVAGLLSRATETADGDESGAERGGTPL